MARYELRIRIRDLTSMITPIQLIVVDRVSRLYCLLDSYEYHKFIKGEGGYPITKEIDSLFSLITMEELPTSSEAIRLEKVARWTAVYIKGMG